jgi:3',5'-cyclic AMP phosphodiesterase CpdA
MRTIVHLSDLHFGRVNPALLAPLIETVTALQPNVVVVSGDLTQRARTAEFKEARRFFDALPSPQIIVPGNHDVPLHNVFSRFLRPLDKYRRYITDDLAPAFIDDEIAVIGINTARSLTFKSGRINVRQIARASEQMCSLPSHLTKIIVTHHPFDLPGDYHERELVRRAGKAMSMFGRCGADLLLAGHLHESHAGNTASRYQLTDYSALVVQAGTATSTRERGEANSFNALDIEPARIAVNRYVWQPESGRFLKMQTDFFERAANAWLSSTR